MVTSTRYVLLKSRVVTSTRPYLLRAIYEWMADNQLTPQLVVDANNDRLQIPRQYVEDGRIVLNIAACAVRNLNLGNEAVEFQARFSGSPFNVYIPVQQVLAIVARENGAGMSFAAEENSQPPTNSEDNDIPPPNDQGPARPKLKIVK